MQPKTNKLSKLKAHAARGEWPQALKIAAAFPDLGHHKAAIMRARECAWNPAFYAQIGHDPDALIGEGIAALKERYNL